MDTPATASTRRRAVRPDHTDSPASSNSTGTAGSTLIFVATAAPSAAPAMSRANRKTTSPNSSVNAITGSRAASMSRRVSLPDSYSSRRPSAPWSPAKPGSRRGWAKATPAAMTSFPSGGCSGL